MIDLLINGQLKDGDNLPLEIEFVELLQVSLQGEVMMDYSILFLTIMKLGILIGIGMLLTFKINFTCDVRRFLIFVIINIALPAIILNGFFQITIDSTLLRQIIFIFFFSIAFNLIGLLIGWFYGKSVGMSALKARETGFLAIFGNTGLIGIPLCAALFGAKGAVFAAVFDAGMSLMLWTVGVLFIQGKKDVSLKNFLSMLTAPNIAVLVGLLVTVFSINPGFLIKDITATVSGAASPLAMFYIGMLTMTIIKEKRRVSAKLVATPVTFKLIIFPIIGMFVLMLLPVTQELKQVLLIEMAMPSITTASIIFAMYQADEDYSLMHTLCSTVFAIVTIPAIALIGTLFL